MTARYLAGIANKKHSVEARVENQRIRIPPTLLSHCALGWRPLDFASGSNHRRPRSRSSREPVADPGPPTGVSDGHE